MSISEIRNPQAASSPAIDSLKNLASKSSKKWSTTAKVLCTVPIGLKLLVQGITLPISTVLVGRTFKKRKAKLNEKKTPILTILNRKKDELYDLEANQVAVRNKLDLSRSRLTDDQIQNEEAEIKRLGESISSIQEEIETLESSIIALEPEERSLLKLESLTLNRFTRNVQLVRLGYRCGHKNLFINAALLGKYKAKDENGLLSYAKQTESIKKTLRLPIRTFELSASDIQDQEYP